MTTGWAVKNVESKVELDSAVAQGGPAFAHFWASWCEPSKHMDEVFAQLAVDTPYAMFFRVEAEEQPEIAEFYGVTTVPFFLFFKDGVVVDKMEGANAPELANKVAKHAGPPTGNAPIPNAAVPSSLGSSAAPLLLEVAQQAHQHFNGSHAAEVKDAKAGLSESLKAEIQSLITSKPIMLFMKGSPEEPRCGFSRKVVDALKAEGVEFGSFDILSNDAVRQGLKDYANWPTYPQLYVKGELIGGFDIVVEMSKNGELKEVLADTLVADTNMLEAVNGAATDNGDSTLQSETDKESDLNQRLKTLINSEPVLLFMKGTPEEPRCGFSRKVVGAMQETGVEFSTFNILADKEVREGLKVFSNWPTYPQLYVKGELIGGCDIIMEMHQSGELKQTFAENGLLQKPSLEDRLKQLINSSENILFMKGTKNEPRCGFSKKVVNALKETEVDFTTFDILSDEEVRQGLKTFSNWPTYPQLYHKGELLGGCDIIMEMKASGELKGALTE